MSILQPETTLMLLCNDKCTLSNYVNFCGHACGPAQHAASQGLVCMDQGAGFWQWYAPGQVGPANEGGGSGRYGILAGDTAFQEIAAFAQELAALDTTVPGCVPPPPAPQPAARDCTRTQVRGLPGTG